MPEETRPNATYFFSTISPPSFTERQAYLRAQLDGWEEITTTISGLPDLVPEPRPEPTKEDALHKLEEEYKALRDDRDVADIRLREITRRVLAEKNDDPALSIYNLSFVQHGEVLRLSRLSGPRGAHYAEALRQVQLLMEDGFDDAQVLRLRRDGLEKLYCFRPRDPSLHFIQPRSN